MKITLVFAVYVLGTLSPFLANSSPTSTAASCPMDLDYVVIIPWDISACKNKQNNTTADDICCQTLRALYGVGLARYLQQTSYFRFHDLATSVACLSDFQTKLSSLSLRSNLISTCLDPLDFVNSTNRCANIYSVQDWLRILGPYTSLDIRCRSSVADLDFCDGCVAAGLEVQSRLVSIDGNKSHASNCFMYAVLYAAGIGNLLGPGSIGALSCILGLSMSRETDPGSNNRKKMVVYGLIGAGSAIFVMCCLIGLYLWRKMKEKSRGISGFDPDSEDRRSKLEWRHKATLVRFKVQDLEKATNRFSQKNLIGRGQFGIVHKGTLPSGAVIAVKKIVDSDESQGEAEFCNEVDIMSTLKHRNLVRLIGYCFSSSNQENHKYLVYDYMPNGNLYDHLFRLHEGFDVSSKKTLTWPQRRSIILDVAKALAYIHYGVEPPVYHRDVKLTNILLDAGMRARLADFGLVKQRREGESHVPTRAAGTHGYLAPEYLLYGSLTQKSDVYSFGIVVLEIMCRRKALVVSSSKIQQSSLITDWAWALVKSGKIEKSLDPSLLGDGNTNPKGLMSRFVLVGILCAHVTVAVRPTILDALKMLEGDMEVPAIPDRPFYADEKIFATA